MKYIHTPYPLRSFMLLHAHRRIYACHDDILSRLSTLPAVRGPTPQRRLKRQEEIVEHRTRVIGPFRREAVHEAPTPTISAALQRADGGERPPRLSRRQSRLREGGSREAYSVAADRLMKALSTRPCRDVDGSAVFLPYRKFTDYDSSAKGVTNNHTRSSHMARLRT